MKRSLLEISQSRRTAKKYNKEILIKEEDLSYIFKVTNSSPSSLGLEAWRVLNIRDKELRVKFLEDLNYYNQQKFIDCSDALIFITKKKEWFIKDNKDLLETIIRNNKIIAKNFNKKFNEQDSIDFVNNIDNFDPVNNSKNLTEWSKRQSYIAFSFAMLAAKELKIDSTPIEGFKESINKKLIENKLMNEDENVSLILLLGYTTGIEKPFIGEKQIRKEIIKKFKTV